MKLDLSPLARLAVQEAIADVTDAGRALLAGRPVAPGLARGADLLLREAARRMEPEDRPLMTPALAEVKAALETQDAAARHAGAADDDDTDDGEWTPDVACVASSTGPRRHTTDTLGG
jgi:hypothetical protein